MNIKNFCSVNGFHGREGFVEEQGFRARNRWQDARAPRREHCPQTPSVHKQQWKCQYKGKAAPVKGQPWRHWGGGLERLKK